MKKQKQSQGEFEQIERYLAGLMPREECAIFEATLKNDPELNWRVEEVRLLQSAVEEQSLRNKLNDFHEEMILENAGNKANGPVIKRGIPYKVFAIAASLALLMGFGYWLLYGQKSTGEKLFAQYFQPDPGLITPMSTTTNYEFYRGMVDYKQEKYEEAINRWKPLIEKKPENDTLNYFIGVSHLALDESDKAIDFLSKAVNYPGRVFVNESWYYLGLAYLKEGKTGDAIKSFKNSKLDNSKKILKEME